MIKAQLLAHIFLDNTHLKKHKSKERQKTTKRTFQWISGLQTHILFYPWYWKIKLQATATSLDNNGLVHRVHKNSKIQPKHSLTYDDIENGLKHLFVNMQSIMPYRSQAAFQISRSIMCCVWLEPTLNVKLYFLCCLLIPFRNVIKLLIPFRNVIKFFNDIPEGYEQRAKEIQFRSVSVWVFQWTWHELYPLITQGKPATDLCHTCQWFSVKLRQDGQFSDEKQCETLKTLNDIIIYLKTREIITENSAKKSMQLSYETAGLSMNNKWGTLQKDKIPLSSHLNTCCNNEPKFSIFPFYKFHPDNASARLSKERYFIHIFDPTLNIK